MTGPVVCASTAPGFVGMITMVSLDNFRRTVSPAESRDDEEV